MGSSRREGGLMPRPGQRQRGANEDNLILVSILGCRSRSHGYIFLQEDQIFLPRYPLFYLRESRVPPLEDHHQVPGRGHP
jgi:hypothetical protein